MKTPFLLSILFTAVFALLSFTNMLQGPIALLNHAGNDVGKQAIMTVKDFTKSKGVKIKSDKPYEVASFSLVWVGFKDDPIEVFVREGGFNQRAMDLVSKAKSGDTYYFEKIMAKLPSMQSEDEWVRLNSIVVRIE